ncbi:MAG: A/G-specific adenine glycosylase [Candidatus Diapherotrites archaeon]|nr:A/G-specific adenine glycosylase [Candidatus Diapherotrites archaeon]
MIFPTKTLLRWFSSNQRSFPWRREYLPYEVWVCEVMAQQTRMDQLLPYYERFLKQFPSLHALASAPYPEVLKAWEGLGYYSRARHLHQAAQKIVKEFSGKIPSTQEELLKLPGFGPYISAAVASIAFQKAVPVVDGNVLRVMARVNAAPQDIADQRTRKEFQEQLQKIIPSGNPRAFNEAIMELGALICTPHNPLCIQCPLQKDCRALALNAVERFPVKKKKAKIPSRHFALLVIRKNGKILLRQRTEKLLAGMWEMPLIELTHLTDSVESIEDKMKKTGLKGKIGRRKGTLTHTYTHFRQEAGIFETKLNGRVPSGMKFFSPKEIEGLPLPRIQHKALRRIIAGGSGS